MTADFPLLDQEREQIAALLDAAYLCLTSFHQCCLLINAGLT